MVNTRAGVKITDPPILLVIFYRSTEADNADIGGGKAPISADIVEKILAYIAQKGSITNSEAQTILGLKETRTTFNSYPKAKWWILGPG